MLLVAVLLVTVLLVTCYLILDTCYLFLFLLLCYYITCYSVTMLLCYFKCYLLLDTVNQGEVATPNVASVFLKNKKHLALR